MWLMQALFGLLIIYIGVNFTAWFRKRSRMMKLIEKLPGPPNIPYAPLINHSIVIIYIDWLQHKLGTFTLFYHLISNTHGLFPDTGICRYWLGLKPVVMIYSPENIESILNSPTVINKADEYRFFEPWIGEGLVTSKEVKWRFRRKILTPAFHFRILSDFMPIMNEEATKLVRKLNQHKYLSKDSVFDVTPLIALCTLDTICETAMGVNLDCQNDENSSYVLALHQVAEMALKRVTRPWLWFDFLFYLTESGAKFTKAKHEMHQFTTKVILERKAAWLKQFSLKADGENFDGQDASSGNRESEKKAARNLTIDDMRASSFLSSGNKKLAFLDILLHQHLTASTMSLEDVREEVDTFMFAGHDTTAMCISWTLYMLGLHPNIQDQVRDELDQVLNGDESERCTTTNDHSGVLANELKTGDINADQLREMKYLDRVIKESLRMWPSIPFVARQMTEDLLLNEKYLIPEGATCMIFTQILHNNPKYFPKPEVFDPDRFLPENTAGRHPFAYIPFSAGPRNCIGQKFAQLEVKIILAKIIRNYFIKTHDHRDKLEIVGELVLRSKNGLNISLAPRIKCTASQNSTYHQSMGSARDSESLE